MYSNHGMAVNVVQTKSWLENHSPYVEQREEREREAKTVSMKYDMGQVFGTKLTEVCLKNGSILVLVVISSATGTGAKRIFSTIDSYRERFRVFLLILFDEVSVIL